MLNRTARLGFALSTLSLLAACAGAPTNPASQPRSAYIVEPKNGAVVGTTFMVKFGVNGIKVSPAAPDGPINDETGHHHLLINRGAMNAGEGVPFADGYMHFGKGQTETEVKLAPGQYKLTAQFANGAHVSYGPKMSHTIEVTVK
jgi:Domain of unknown function (DUF4399)